MVAPLRLKVNTDADVERARHAAHDLAQSTGFDPAGRNSLALAVSELATNLVRHAGGGEIILSVVENRVGVGLRVESLDQGPGIKNADEAVRDGISTAGTMGSGLGVVRRQMDEFEIATGAWGTRIVIHKWLNSH